MDENGVHYFCQKFSAIYLFLQLVYALKCVPVSTETYNPVAFTVYRLYSPTIESHA